MFHPLADVYSRRRNACLSASLALHCLFLAMLLRSPAPIFISPNSIVGGERGTQVTHLYWDGAASQAAEEPHRQRLTFSPPKKRKQDSAAVTSKFAVENESAARRDTEPGRPAGSPYGSLSEGTLSGYEVRPALPVYTYDPHVDATELPAGFEGNIVVEITIDDQGNVVQEIVTESIAPNIDAKVLAAVRNWHFHPATRDGVAIASKQDVYYHFPRR